MTNTKVIYKIGQDTYCCIVPDQTHEHIKECLKEAGYELISLTDID